MTNKVYNAYKRAYSSKQKSNPKCLTIEAIVVLLLILIITYYSK